LAAKVNNGTTVSFREFGMSCSLLLSAANCPLPLETQTAPPQAQLAQMATAYWVSDIVYVAAKLSLADHLAEGPRTAEELPGQQGLTLSSIAHLLWVCMMFNAVKYLSDGCQN
jgi:hypothetical protein